MVYPNEDKPKKMVNAEIQKTKRESEEKLKRLDNQSMLNRVEYEKNLQNLKNTHEQEILKIQQNQQLKY